MYFSLEIVKHAYDGLIRIDLNEGKSRQEKISGLRYLLATSRVLKEQGGDNINLSVSSDLRKRFIEAVGEVVALNETGLYSKDFSHEFEVSADYKVGSNFLTTRLANSRNQKIKYPGRPAPLLLLDQEHVSIIDNVSQTVNNSFGINDIKTELCIWLVRNQNLDNDSIAVDSGNVYKLINYFLHNKYTDTVVNSILPPESDFQAFVAKYDVSVFSKDKPDYSNISVAQTESDDLSPALVSLVLKNNLPDDDKIYIIVQELLSRGSKGILFSGPPGTSKTWYALKIALKIIDGDEKRLERVQFHPSFSYEDFIEGLVSTGSISGDKPLFTPKKKVFLSLCDKARIDKDNLYILIVDEFSRGDPSKIFGELLTYIEPDYREIPFRLPYSDQEVSIPQNVVIFATMNPYDKSVVDLDSAMERRFEVIELLPDVSILKTLLMDSGARDSILGNIISFFNTANQLSPHGFGHTYFKNVNSDVDFILLWNHKLKFVFEKMFRFKDDSYKQVKDAYTNIVSEDVRNKIT